MRPKCKTCKVPAVDCPFGDHDFFECNCLVCSWDWWYWHEESYLECSCDAEPPLEPDPREDCKERKDEDD